MVQARDRSSAELLGTFDAVPDKVRVIDCLGGTAVNLMQSLSSTAITTL